MGSKKNFTRRTMLKTILWTPPALLLSKGGAFAAEKIKPLYKPRIVPPGTKIRAAQIGVFNRGAGVLAKMMKFSDSQVEFTAFADVLFTSHDYEMKKFPGVPCFRDYREMFEQMHDKIDAVVICTPDHSHFPMLVHAMLLGKHVYVEKPLAQNVYECRLLRKLEASCGVVTQMGNQGHSDFGTKQFGDWVDAGLIKNVKKIDAWMTKPRRWHGWTIQDYPDAIPPIGYDWDQWLGRRPFRPHSDKLTDGNWRCWYDFGCGAMGDWGAHVLDAMHRYLKLGLPYEISTELFGPNDLYYPQGSTISFKFPKRDGMPPVELKWSDGQGNMPAAPKGYDKKLPPIGSLIYLDNAVVTGTSHGANYHFGMNKELEAKEKAGELPGPKKKLSNHYQNFLNACQDIEPANSPFSISTTLTEIFCLGCIGQRFGGTLKYNAKAMEITNNAAANRMLSGPEVREGWDAYDGFKVADSKKSRIKSTRKAKWEDLLADKALSNWENPYDWGKAELKDGVVSLSSENKKWFLLTKKEYANFVFEAEIMMPVDEGNSGFMFRCQKTKNKAWGYQAEVDTQPRKWSGGLYDEGRRKWFISPNRDQAGSESKKQASIAEFRKRAGECFKQGKWNKYRIECVGSSIKISVNGVVTTDVHDEMDLKGHIGLQHHGEKGLVYQFRNVRIKDLGTGGAVYYAHRENAKAAAVESKMKGWVYEAETAKLAGCKASDKNKGYQGTGYADMSGAGSSVEWDNVLGETAGEYTLTFRYATPKNRPCDLLINGKSVGKLPMTSTGGWKKWKTFDKKVTFNKGANYIKVVAIGEGPNLDAVAVNK